MGHHSRDQRFGDAFRDQRRYALVRLARHARRCAASAAGADSRRAANPTPSGSWSNTSSAAPPSRLARNAAATRGFVDDAAARRVDQDRVVLHRREPLRIDQVARRGVSGTCSVSDVRLAQRPRRTCAASCRPRAHSVAAAGTCGSKPIVRMPSARAEAARQAADAAEADECRASCPTTRGRSTARRAASVRRRSSAVAP